MTKVAIISDNNLVLNSTFEKLILLRHSDSVVKCGINEYELVKNSAKIIILHVNCLNDEELKYISKLVNDENILILMCNNFEQQSLLQAYDLGISDFCTVNIPNYELIIKVINAQKLLDKNTLIKNLRFKLSSKGVLDNNSGMYKDLSETFKDLNSANTAILALTVKDREKFINILGEKLFLKHIRANDKIVKNEDFKYLFLLQDTDIRQVIKIFERMKKMTGVSMNGVALKLNTKTKEDVLNTIQKLEVEQISTKNDFIAEMFGEDEKEEDWLDTEISIDEPKNYKFFQTIYNNKSEKVITPVFYRTVQKYENNFKDTKIKYYVDKTSAELVVVNFDVKNEFRISFQNSPKVKIEEIYSKINANESKEYLMSFADLTIRNLTSLVEKFITVCPKE